MTTETIDYLNDPLLVVDEVREKAARTAVAEMAAGVLASINAFHEEHGRAPVSAKGQPVRERLLANELAGLRANREALEGLEDLDVHGLVFDRGNAHSTIDETLADPLLMDSSGIFEVREQLQPKAAPDYVADRQRCPDFERFVPLLDEVRQAVAKGIRKPQPFRQERVEVGEFFVLKGQLIYVASMHDEHERNGRLDSRLRVIFDNGMESNLLMTSLVRRLYEDKAAKRIGTSNAGPLFQGARTGYVYVLRSKARKPEIQGLLKVGTTAGAVEDRIARADTQSSFLYADVEIVETYELMGHSAKEAEAFIHKALRVYHVPLKVTGPDGRVHNATEWFKVSEAKVGEVMRKLFER